MLWSVCTPEPDVDCFASGAVLALVCCHSVIRMGLQFGALASLQVVKAFMNGLRALSHQLVHRVYESSASVQVDLVDIMDSLVGTGRGVGLSTEQRKRLTIAVELVANPSAVFMVCFFLLFQKHTKTYQKQKSFLHVCSLCRV